ncbi:hypothetical protein BDDG_02507 [Blastomyces dermatitidis ATCC 18188]|uniref:Uncharacterized protein n=2 Tax=Ajellomyces dermatitidis TaxID=5039 RepID=F2T8K3_AJEDA|nr:hypothetical protein BDDG_02507 [Blastomyces dermatitidis ATCC 18188]
MAETVSALLRCGTIMHQALTRVQGLKGFGRPPLRGAVTDPTRTTQGTVTKPANRRVPSRITLWDTFIDEQMMVWERLNGNPSFLTEKLFPSKHQLEYVRQLITPNVIGQDSDDVEFCCRRLVVVVTTQLCSYMVHKGVCYSYICTGEAFIFIHILDDSSSVQCALCRPELNVKVTGENELQLTAATQVLVFTIQALISPAVPQEWHDAAARFDVWPVKYSEILEQTPPAAHSKHASPLYCGRQLCNLPPFGMML